MRAFSTIPYSPGEGRRTFRAFSTKPYEPALSWIDDYSHLIANIDRKKEGARDKKMHRRTVLHGPGSS